VLTKTKAYVGRPMTEKMLVKKMQGKLELYSNKLLNLLYMTLPFNLDHADLSFLIITHHLEQDYAKKNNFGYFIESVYEKLYLDYYDKLKPSNSKKKKCICQ